MNIDTRRLFQARKYSDVNTENKQKFNILKCLVYILSLNLPTVGSNAT
jgi:hypothetical protein